jgi:hypothetical protein
MVLLTFAPTLLGRAGFLLVDAAFAERFFPYHLHGIEGEADYVREHGRPAPFVHPHCHPEPGPPAEQTPAEMTAAGVVHGPVLCAGHLTVPAAPVNTAAAPATQPARPLEVARAPLPPPPKA